MAALLVADGAQVAGRSAEPARGVATSGAASGTQTQPATLAAAYEISGRSDEVYVAYALVYPVAMIGKILIAQLIALM